ncbi:ATP-binding protein [Leifsonia sp. WHRI 6310E]|uniref:ATP-binding protein n=1 Tax=Leifsonia sp. WHRI 6310E TaxID=3162562 RepID=UPI0032EFD2C9
MSLAADRARLADAVRAAVANAHDHAPVVLIDGPSGAGKSSLADDLLSAWPAEGTPRLVRMDDLYPGWDGLDAGSTALGRELLEPLRRTGSGRWRRWDWAQDRPADWVEVHGREPVIVEGCGTLARANVAAADLALWLDADDTLRKRRALDRDGATFAQNWDRWQAEFDAYLLRERPRAAASLRLDVTDWPLGPARVRHAGD